MSRFRCTAVHIALTPLAGSPIRIVRALNAHTEVAARLLTLHHYPVEQGFSFPMDLRGWVPEEMEEFRAVLDTADVIHLHHWMDLRENSLGIDLTENLRRGQRIVRQFHSNLRLVAGSAGLTEQQILEDPLPQLTLPQLHERYYGRARVVPNIVPIDEAPYSDARPSAEGGLSVYFRPSSYGSAWSDRWETKGAPEVMRALEWAKGSIPKIRIDAELKGIPFDEQMRRRAACSVSIDDVVTGSFHLTSLESFAQGLAVICYLDPRQVAALTRFTGSDELPFINFAVEELPVVLDALSRNLPLVRALGERGRRWMETYWHPKAMAEHYVSAYEGLLRDGAERFDEPRFDTADAASRWLRSECEDLRWLVRRSRMDGAGKQG